MNFLLEKLTGMDKLTDQVIAMDILIGVKSGVRNTAMAVTEAVSPEIRTTLMRQLEEQIDLHERIANYVMEKGWYRPWNVTEQIDIDLEQIDLALKAPTF